MFCIKDFEQCHWNGSLGYCCSGHCVQSEGHEFGFCEATATSTAPSCLTSGSTCKPDGSLGVCCSLNCFTRSPGELGTCIGTDPPTNVTEKCLADGKDCKLDGSLGFCCGSFCKVIAPHIIGVCETTRTTSKTDFENLNSSKNYTWMIYTSVSLVAALVVVIGFIWLYRRQRKLETGFYYNDAKRFFSGDSELFYTDGYAHENTDNIPYNKELEISESDFTVDWESPLGEGCYGVVLKGKLKKNVDIAVKTVRNNHSINETYLRALLSEIKILQYVGKCENIVSMVGCHTAQLQNGKAFLLLEYCPMGSLEKYLQACKHDFLRKQSISSLALSEGYYSQLSESDFQEDLTMYDLMMWSLQITKAMIHLKDKKVIHADIASRNVLLLRKDCVKLTDFGLSRRLYEYTNYIKKNQEPLPWRWMALESLQNLTFSHQSDVWSLGITIWEIYSLGDLPYGPITWSPDFTSYLENNIRPMKPPRTPDAVYQIMLDCWKLIPDERLTFNEVHARLSELQFQTEFG